jgi:hypothetical protein
MADDCGGTEVLTAQKADLTKKRTLEGVFEAEDMTTVMMKIVF